MVSCRFSLDLPLFGLGPSSKGHESNLWLSSNKIALFHWTLELGSSSKVDLRVVHVFEKFGPLIQVESDRMHLAGLQYHE
jgi:hypothetical protein